MVVRLIWKSSYKSSKNDFKNDGEIQQYNADKKKWINRFRENDRVVQIEKRDCPIVSIL